MTDQAARRDAYAALRRLVDDEPEVRTLYLRYLGVLGLLAECSVHVDEETRESIVQACTDAEDYGLSWRRILNRIEIEPHGGG